MTSWSSSEALTRSVASPADLETPTPPETCGLAMALPLTEMAFAADLRAGSAMDYARGLIGIRSPDAAWRDSGGPLAELAEVVMAEAHAAGVTVVREAGLDDLRGLAAAFRVLIVVAHWRDHRFIRDDLRLPAAEIAGQLIAAAEDARMRDGINSMTKEVPAVLSEAALAAIVEGCERMPEDRLAALLNELLAPTPEEEGLLTADAFWQAAMRRKALDTWWPEAFEPGNRLELRDGLHAPETIEEALPIDWSGIIDFANCHSMLLAETVKKGRPERQVMMRQHRLDPRFYLQLLRHTLAEIGSREQNYAAVMLDIYRQLIAQCTGTRAGLWRRLGAGIGL